MNETPSSPPTFPAPVSDGSGPVAARSAGPAVRWLRRLSWVMMAVAVLLVGYVGLLIGYQGYAQHQLRQQFDARVPQAARQDVVLTGSVQRQPTLQPHLADGEPLARLEMPAAHFDAIVTEGADTGILSSGPGHDNHTLYPGEGGVIVIGNHNGFSMSWGDLHVGDDAFLTMSYGRFHYRITKRSIVDGGDTAVVSQNFGGETLLISTCWPLWQGSFARQRLVFEATPVTS